MCIDIYIKLQSLVIQTSPSTPIPFGNFIIDTPSSMVDGENLNLNQIPVTIDRQYQLTDLGVATDTNIITDEEP